jgi:hypothetical protein
MTTSDGRLIPNLNAMNIDGRFKNNFHQSKNLQYRYYACPRCKGRFRTKEEISYYSYAYNPNSDDIERYDKQNSLNKIDSIIEEHIDSNYPDQSDIIQRTKPEKEIIVDVDSNIINITKDTSRMDEYELQDLTLKLFGEDILKDIERDLQDLLSKGKITLDNAYKIRELLKI